jgi:hypothetical protein
VVNARRATGMTSIPKGLAESPSTNDSFALCGNHVTAAHATRLKRAVRGHVLRNR